MKLPRLIAIPFFVTLIASCENTTPPVSPDAGPQLATLTMPAVPLAPGEEKTLCVTLQLANATPQMLRRIHSTITQGSHHLIAYRVAAGTPIDATPTACLPFADITMGASPVIIAESADAQVVYPAGVGLPLEANQTVKLEQHFVNSGEAAIESSGTVEFELAEPDDTLVAANLMFWGPQQFQIPPHSHGAADLFQLVDPGTKVFALTTHEHHFGTLAVIEQSATADGSGTELYRNADWEHPPLKSFEPVLAFDGTQGLRVHCEWFNTSAEVVDPGLSAVTNEMCFFWAYYYPSTGFQLCTEQGCQKT